MKVVGLQTFIWQNNFRSLALMILFPLILGGLIFAILFGISITETSSVSGALTGSVSLMQELGFSIIGAVLLWFMVAWMFHTSMILGMTGAKPLSRKESPEIYNIVENLCISRGVPTPSLYIIEDSSMNAFASGLSPNRALIAFSRGLLESLTKEEIEAVAAHELTHILNRDSRFMIIAIIFVGIIQTLAEIFLRTRIDTNGNGKDSGNAALILFLIKILVYIIGFFITLIVQLAISRKREYLADAGAVELTKTSKHLISALRKISGDARIEAIENRNVAQLCIENPLERGHSFMSNLFSTHPSTEDRIKALELIG
ncbi:protease [Candidatus Gracilibacteria bacterium CG17_big_fil_post_rev_8_21_14_2_50_48_13]|nr:MAG: protease [Candidatus Gracilibacteria bacterium CG17_big_fil_post_rev_8_21_14_2_50_48_13]